MEVLSNSLMVSLTPAINQCIHDIFTAIGLPTIEKTCQTMFSQVNNAFSKGVKECKYQTMKMQVAKSSQTTIFFFNLMFFPCLKYPILRNFLKYEPQEEAKNKKVVRCVNYPLTKDLSHFWCNPRIARSSIICTLQKNFALLIPRT